MMRTLFLQAPSYDGFDGGAGSRYQAKREVRSFWYPTWLAQPAALVEGSKLIDAPPHRIGLDAVTKQAKDYDLVVLHTSTPSFRRDVKTIEAMKAVNPGLKVGLIGAKVAVEGDKSLEAAPLVDFVARNEFDFAIKEVAEGRDLSTITGLTWRNKAGGIVQNAERRLPARLGNSAPSPPPAPTRSPSARRRSTAPTRRAPAGSPPNSPPSLPIAGRRREFRAKAAAVAAAGPVPRRACNSASRFDGAADEGFGAAHGVGEVVAAHDMGGDGAGERAAGAVQVARRRARRGEPARARGRDEPIDALFAREMSAFHQHGARSEREQAFALALHLVLASRLRGAEQRRRLAEIGRQAVDERQQRRQRVDEPRRGERIAGGRRHPGS